VRQPPWSAPAQAALIPTTIGGLRRRAHTAEHTIGDRRGRGRFMMVTKPAFWG